MPAFHSAVMPQVRGTSVPGTQAQAYQTMRGEWQR